MLNGGLRVVFLLFSDVFSLVFTDSFYPFLTQRNRFKRFEVVGNHHRCTHTFHLLGAYVDNSLSQGETLGADSSDSCLHSYFIGAMNL